MRSNAATAAVARPANDAASATTRPSAGPWAASFMDERRSGAVPIIDVDGEQIGWATDAAGHTTELVDPDRRDPLLIGYNARAFAEAREMLAICDELAQIGPKIAEQLLGTNPVRPNFLRAVRRAWAVLGRVYVATPSEHPPRPPCLSPLQEHARWWSLVRDAAPSTPTWFAIALARILCAREMSSDALLILADAIEECARTASFDAGAPPGLPEQLRKLAELPRDLAPKRARRLAEGDD